MIERQKWLEVNGNINEFPGESMSQNFPDLKSIKL